MHDVTIHSLSMGLGILKIEAPNYHNLTHRVGHTHCNDHAVDINTCTYPIEIDQKSQSEHEL